jgi:molybdate transport system ATP-binding protein
MKFSASLRLRRGTFDLAADFDIKLTGITALFGATGSGKTSLLRALAGIERATGHISADGAEWQNDRLFLPPHRRAIGYIFQEADLFPHLSVRENLVFGYKRRAPLERRFHPAELTDLLGLENLLPGRVSGLSGGERQLVALGRALLSSPRILFMDEPLAALDRDTKARIYPLLLRIAERMGIPILYVSHSLDEVARLADQMVLMSDGKIMATGATGAMLTRLDLSLAQSPEAEVLISGFASNADVAGPLTAVVFPGGKFLTHALPVAPGENVRLRIAASDVSLALTHRTDSSILNIFPAQIMEMRDLPQNLVLVKLRFLAQTPSAEESPVVLARITKHSAITLNLQHGQQVFAQIKGAAVLWS